jgi:hypothetical protein
MQTVEYPFRTIVAFSLPGSISHPVYALAFRNTSQIEDHQPVRNRKSGTTRYRFAALILANPIAVDIVTLTPICGCGKLYGNNKHSWRQLMNFEKAAKFIWENGRLLERT